MDILILESWGRTFRFHSGTKAGNGLNRERSFNYILGKPFDGNVILITDVLIGAVVSSPYLSSPRIS